MGALKVIIAGGGTGGHIFPAVAVAHALKRLQPQVQLLFVGARGKMEMEKVPQEGFEIVGLDIAGFDRSNMLKNLTLPLKLLKSRIQSRQLLRDFKPDAVVGVGGYASFPILSAAQSMGIPSLVQEQNSYAGKSNKILAKRAAAICVAYHGMEQFFPKEKLLYTGNPVRKQITITAQDCEDGKMHFGLEPGGRVLLVIGGSQGARTINEAIDKGLDALLADGLQVIWQTGKPYLEQAKARAAAYGNRVVVTPFITNMGAAYAAASIIVSRAGALAIAELCIAGKPVIFVPYPHAAEDHQTSNARALVAGEAAVLVQDSAAEGTLVQEVLRITHDEALQKELGQNIKAMAILDADERIAKMVMKIAGVNTTEDAQPSGQVAN